MQERGFDRVAKRPEARRHGPTQHSRLRTQNSNAQNSRLPEFSLFITVLRGPALIQASALASTHTKRTQSAHPVPTPDSPQILTFYHCFAWASPYSTAFWTSSSPNAPSNGTRSDSRLKTPDSLLILTFYHCFILGQALFTDLWASTHTKRTQSAHPVPTPDSRLPTPDSRLILTYRAQPEYASIASRKPDHHPTQRLQEVWYV